MSSFDFQSLIDDHKTELNDGLYKKFSDLCLKKHRFENSFYKIYYEYTYHQLDPCDITNVDLFFTIRKKIVHMSEEKKMNIVSIWNEKKDFKKLPRSFTTLFHEKEQFEICGISFQNVIKIENIIQMVG